MSRSRISFAAAQLAYDNMEPPYNDTCQCVLCERCSDVGKTFQRGFVCEDCLSERYVCEDCGENSRPVTVVGGRRRCDDCTERAREDEEI